MVNCTCARRPLVLDQLVWREIPAFFLSFLLLKSNCASPTKNTNKGESTSFSCDSSQVLRSQRGTKINTRSDTTNNEKVQIPCSPTTESLLSPYMRSAALWAVKCHLALQQGVTLVCKDHRQELKWLWLTFPVAFSHSPWKLKHRCQCCFPWDAMSFCNLKYLRAQDPFNL